MTKNKSLTIGTFAFIVTVSLLIILSVNTYSQMKYDVKFMINEKVLFKDCIKDGSELFVSAEELAMKIDGSITIEAPYKLGPYFKFKGAKLSLIKTGSGLNAELNVMKKGVLSPEIRIIILDGKQHVFIPFEEFVMAVGGSWKYDEATDIYGVTVGGCGACLINESVN